MRAADLKAKFNSRKFLAPSSFQRMTIKRLFHLSSRCRKTNRLTFLTRSITYHSRTKTMRGSFVNVIVSNLQQVSMERNSICTRRTQIQSMSWTSVKWVLLTSANRNQCGTWNHLKWKRNNQNTEAFSIGRCFGNTSPRKRPISNSRLHSVRYKFTIQCQSSLIVNY